LGVGRCGRRRGFSRRGSKIFTVSVDIISSGGCFFG
jgi:hypothetical protein